MSQEVAIYPSSPSLEAHAAPGLMSPQWRAVTVAIVALISIAAFEHLAVATVMPMVAQALNGLPLYAAAFGAAIAASIVGMAAAGRGCDRFGPIPVMWVGVIAFVLGVIAVGAAPTMPALVAGRVLQGLGGGMQSVALYVLVGRVYPPTLHPRIFAIFAAAWVLPVIVGPTIAGLIAEHAGWRWVFFSALLIALPAAGLMARGLRRVGAAAAAPIRTTPNAAPTRSTPGLAVVAAIGASLLHVAQAQPWLLVAALLAVAWAAPRLLPAGALRGRAGLPAVVALRGLAAAAFFCGEVLIPLLLVQERGLSPLQAGLVLTVGALGWSAGSWYQGRRAVTGAARVRLLRAGMAMICAGVLLVMPALLPQLGVLAAMLLAGAGWTLAGLGIGMVYPTLSVLTLECAPPAEHGAASSSLQLADALFSTLGLALAHALLAAWQPQAPLIGFLAGFGVAALLSLLGVALAGRARPV